MPVPQSRLRPLDVGSLIDEAISLYRQHWKLFLTICAIVLIPTGIIQLVVTLMLDTSFDSEDTGELLAAAFGGLLSGLVSGIGLLMLSAAMVHAASAAWHDEAINVNEAFDRGFSRIGWLLLLLLLVGLALGAMAITIIGFPVAVYFGVSWAFAATVLLLENTGVTRSLGRSRELVSGAWWRVFGIIILIAIIQSVISAFFTLPGTILGAGSVLTGGSPDETPVYARVVSQIGSTAGQIVTYPIAACAYILLYYDLRIRKEGLDLRLATERMEQPIVSPDRSF